MKRMFWIVALTLAGVAAALLQVSLRYRVVQAGYAIAVGLQERRALEEENRKLQLEQSLLRNPERIEHLATEKLGMVRPDPSRIRVVRAIGRELAQNGR